jgi:hypothetical protein
MPGPLKNRRHEAFANEVFRQMPKGGNTTAIYRKFYPKVSAKAADAAASRLLKRVKPRISELQSKVTARAALTMSERRDFMARVVRANLSAFDPEKDGDLIEEITEEKDGKRRYKLPSKRACIMDDAKLAGELIDKTDLTTDGEALPTAMPSVNLQMPVGFLARRGSQAN